MPGQVKTITSLPSAATLTGSEVVPLDQSGSTVKALVSAISSSAAAQVNNVKSFGALGDGTTNDTTSVQNAIDNLPSTGGIVFFPPGVYVINGTLSVLDKECIILRGSGAEHDTIYTVAPTRGTVLKRVSGVGTLLSVGASASASSVMSGLGVESLSIDGNNLAATGLLVTSVYGGSFRDLHIRNCTTVALDVTTRDMTGVEDTQECQFERITVRQIESATGIGIRLGSGLAGIGNTSLNTFDDIIIFHNNGVGLQMNDTDTNRLIGIQTNRNGGGTAIGVELGASNHASSGHCRSNSFYLLQSGAGGVTARATGFSQPSNRNTIISHSRGNSSPLPMVEDGAGLFWVTEEGLSTGIRYDYRRNVMLQDDFVGGTNSSGTIGELGWGLSAGTSTSIVGEADHIGIKRIDTTASSGTVAAIHLGTNGTAILLPAEMFDLTFVVKLETNDADTLVRMGIAASANGNPSSSGVYVEKLEADTQWFGVTRSASVQSRTAALASVTTNWVKFRIRRKDASTIGFTIDDGTEVTATANIPTAGLQTFLHIRNNVALSKTILIDYSETIVTNISR